MYLQSAEILNFHGIRHLKINFEPETSALIGENAWGKSSLLSALWLVLGQGPDKLCTFSKNDLYVPIRLGSDALEPLAAHTATPAIVPYSASLSLSQINKLPNDLNAVALNAVADTKANATMDKQSPANVETDSKEYQAKALLQSKFSYLSPEFLSELKPYKVITYKDYQRYYFSVPDANHTSNILRIIDLPIESASYDSPASHTSQDFHPVKTAASRKHHKHNSKNPKQSKSEHDKANLQTAPAPQALDPSFYTFHNLALESFLRHKSHKYDDSHHPTAIKPQAEKLGSVPYELKTAPIFKDKATDNASYNVVAADNTYNTAHSNLNVTLADTNEQYATRTLDSFDVSHTAINTTRSGLHTPSAKAKTSSNTAHATLNTSSAYSNHTNVAIHNTGGIANSTENRTGFADPHDYGTATVVQENSVSDDEIFKALREAQTQEADFERQTKHLLTAQHLMLRARNLLDSPDGLDDSARNLAQADYDFFANDIYQDSADKLVIDLVFCENSYGAINNTERFAQLRRACYYGEDDLYRIHYRVTGLYAKNLEAKQASGIVLSSSDSSTTGDPHKSSTSSSDVYSNTKENTTSNDVHFHTPENIANNSQLEAQTTRQDDESFVTVHELLDKQGQPVEDALELIKDLIKLNPLLRLRDRRMLSSREIDEQSEIEAQSNRKEPANETDSQNTQATQDESSSQDESLSDLCKLRSLFTSISLEDDLTCTKLNQGLADLNVIASKYLTNYRSNHYLQNYGQSKTRTARDIVSHPVSIETLNSLKLSLEDKRPSRSKLLLSLLAGALMMSTGTQDIDTFSKPILVLEDIEGRFHPTLLLSFWSILNTIPIQKIVTTNSSALLSVMPMSNIRRLCRQYYDVRCYSIGSQAFNADDARRIAFHIRISRPSAFFARCWILVEGETEVWMLNEIAGILGMDLACEGVKTIEFAQCGLAPLIKLAKQLGISYYVLTDGDDAGRKYAQTVQSFTGTQHISDHLSVIPHLDIEHYFYVSGYADVYQKAAGIELRPKKKHTEHTERKELSKLLTKAQHMIEPQAAPKSALQADYQIPNPSAHKVDGAITQSSTTQSVELISHSVTQILGQQPVVSSAQQPSVPSTQESTQSNTPHTLSEVHLSAQYILKTLQRYCSRRLSKASLHNGITLTDEERQALQKYLTLGWDVLNHYAPENSLKQDLEQLTFDLSKVTIAQVEQYYEKLEQNVRQSGISNRKLTHRQQQAIQKLQQEKAEVLYGLKLTNKKPKTKNLFKGHLGKSSKFVRTNFTLPSTLYNYLKNNFTRQHYKEISALQNKLNAASNLKRPPALSSVMTSRDSNYIKSLASKLHTLINQLNTSGQPIPYLTISHEDAVCLFALDPHQLDKLQQSALPTMQNVQLNLQQTVQPTMQYEGNFQHNEEHEARFASNIQPEAKPENKQFHSTDSVECQKLSGLLNEQIVTSGSCLSTKQWVNKMAQAEEAAASTHDLNITKQADLALSTAHLDPLDEAKVLRKVRQQNGINYEDYGAIDQAVLNKQGWSMDKVIDSAIHKKSKPGLAIMVVEAMQQRGPDAVPQMFRTMFMKIKRIAKSEFGI